MGPAHTGRDVVDPARRRHAGPGGGRLRIGVVADTHGLVRPEVVEQLQGSHVILHAGDVGGPHVLHVLERIAPVHAVRGNVDLPGYLTRARGRAAFDPQWAADLPDRLRFTAGGVRVAMVHDIADVDGTGWMCDVVVVGHSHVPRVEAVQGALVVNPGSCGPRRFRLPVSMAEMVIEAGEPAVTLVSLGE